MSAIMMKSSLLKRPRVIQCCLIGNNQSSLLYTINKLTSLWHTVAQVCNIYGVKKQTVSDIKRFREKLEKYSI